MISDRYLVMLTLASAVQCLFSSQRRPLTRGGHKLLRATKSSVNYNLKRFTLLEISTGGDDGSLDCILTRRVSKAANLLDIFGTSDCMIAKVSTL